MNQDIIELREDVTQSSFYSPEMAPTSRRERNWGTKDFAVFWISLSACIPTYMLASSMIQHGMDWKQALLTILLGNLIVLLPILLNAHAGTKYGITFPIYCRSAFGILGANIPAMLRALVACGWFGIQTWIGGQAIYVLLGVFYPDLKQQPALSLIGINAGQLSCFIAFWILNVLVVLRGIGTIRWLLNIKAPLMVLMGIALLVWAWFEAKGFGPMLAKPSDFVAGGSKAGQFWSVFFPHLTATVGFWATLSLNIPDFSRYAKSQSSQMLGQALGLPASMVLFSFIGIAVTSATVVMLGRVEWDPIKLMSKFENPVVLVVAMIALCLATLATNIAANVVGPANDFVHLAPKWLSFRTAALISCLLGILIQPWNLINDPSGYIFRWLIAYSAVLGAVGGILIADYYLLRKTRLNLAELYQREGQYWYVGGFNICAMVALMAGIAPNMPGLLADLYPTIMVDRIWGDLYQHAWFLELWNRTGCLLRLNVDNRFTSGKSAMRSMCNHRLNAIHFVSGFVICGMWIWVGCSTRHETRASRTERSFEQQIIAVQKGTTLEIYSSEPVTDREFRLLQGLVDLEILSLQNAPLTDDAAETLRSLIGLRQLRLEKAKLGDHSAEAIGTLARLTTLNLPDSEISNTGIQRWPSLSELILLRIGSPNLTDLSIETLGRMGQLRFLHLVNVPISDSGLKHLYRMRQLESFYLDGSLATDQGLVELIEALPELHFHRDQQHLANDPRADDHGKD